MKDPRSVIIQPVLTEKALRLKDTLNQYIFNVAADANKIEIKSAIEKRFSVKVKSIRTENVKPKPRQRFTRSGRVQGYTSHWKKAIVTLGEGDKLDFLENL
ncbi:MAG: 50S ribosomal protein L23 [Calditrichaeota bacterium]|nr:50S ribosomal protein L23 [Calditrichota bacterium]RQV92351.1 MAG: 50S ribosomal protein L23 [bacterium]RQV98694.1 MAG: 50S ribosomal protein L23 [Calditrichota bacterium]